MDNRRSNQVYFEEEMGALQTLSRDLGFEELAIVMILLRARKSEEFRRNAILYLYDKSPSQEEFLTTMGLMEKKETRS